MSKSYFYTVTNAINGKVMVTGSSKECAAVIGVTVNAISRAARTALHRGDYFLNGKYIVTRRLSCQIHPDSKYYEVRLHETGELVCAGTSSECADMLGLPSVAIFRNMVRNSNSEKVWKWIITSVPYASVSPDLTPIPPTNNSASARMFRHKKPREPKPPRDNSLWYSVYLKKTDELICSGTASDCAKALGMKSYTYFHILTHKVRKGANKKYEIYSEPYHENLNFDEEENE